MRKILLSLLGSFLIAAGLTAQTPAKSLATTGAPVNVGNAAPPSGSGKACITTDATHCTWQTAGGGGSFVNLQGSSPGTPDTGNVNVTGAGIFGGVSLISSAPGDTATATTFFSATDTGPTTSNVSIGIELPNSPGNPGDLVIRTGGSGASSDGTERVRVVGQPAFGSGIGFAPSMPVYFNASASGTDFAPTFGAVNIRPSADGSGGGSAIGLLVTDAAYDLGGFSAPLTVIAATGPAVMFERGVSNFPQSLLTGLLNLGVNLANATALVLENSDTSGGADYIQTHWYSSESPSIHAHGVFEFQNSGNGDGASWFGMNHDGSNTDIFRFWSDGGFDIGTNASVSPGPNSLAAAGNVLAATYSCSAMPAAAGASGTIYADPVTHALFITP